MYLRIALLFICTFGSLHAADDQRLNIAWGKGQKSAIPIGKRWPKDSMKPVVCLWPDGKTAAFTMTIDDNWRPDHERWLELAAKYDVPLTWFVVTGGVGGNNPKFNGTWADWQKLIDAGHDVQSHTKSHRSRKANLSCEEDYGDSQKALQANLEGQAFTVLAYPGSGLANEVKTARRFYIGARGVRGLLNDPDRTGYINTNSISGLRVFDKPAGHWASFAGLLDPKNKSKYRRWMCIHYHGIGETEGRLEKAFSTLKEHEDEMWVTTFREVMMYGQERDTSSVSAKQVGDSYELTLTDRMNDAVFDYPLTVKWRLPKAWDAVRARQVEKDCPVTVIERKGARFALINAIPDRGPIVLSKG